MVKKVLVVDDSGFFRKLISDLINSDARFKVVATANNGMEAVELARKLKPDVITMDFEMPVMDGITATKQIMDESPIPILMFSSLTVEGARTTLDAFEAGAVDFMPKNLQQINAQAHFVRKQLIQKLLTVSSAKIGQEEPKPAQNTPEIKKGRLAHIKLLVIGTSTGGPEALNKIFKVLPSDFNKPILIVQHMPASFTQAFAERLNKRSQISVKEAANGDSLLPGCAYVAPGGMQLMLSSEGKKICIRESDERMTYRPSVDIAFASAAKHYGKDVLGIVLTGMGHDGTEGARIIKQVGGQIWTQDEETSTVFGMPESVLDAGFSDLTVSLPDLGQRIAAELIR